MEWVRGRNMSEILDETDKILNDYKAVNRMQNEKIEMLSRELCEKNDLIEKLYEENKKLRDKYKSTSSCVYKVRNLFKVNGDR